MKVPRFLKKSWRGIPISLLTLLLSAGIAVAVWAAFWSGYTGYSVTSLPPDVEFITDFSTGNILDGSNSDVWSAQQVQIKNNGATTVFCTYTTNTSITDVEDACVDYENDCSITYQLNNFDYLPWEEFEAQWSPQELTPLTDAIIRVKVSCLKGSCPQTVDVGLSANCV